MQNWLISACGDEIHNGVDVTKIYATEVGLVASDAKRIHLLPTEDTSLYPMAPKIYGCIHRTVSSPKRREIDLGLWCRTSCGKYVVHLIEGIRLNLQFFEDATLVDGMRCMVADEYNAVLFRHEATGAEAYVLPIIYEIT